MTTLAAPPVLQVADLTISFGSGGRQHTVVEDLGFSLADRSTID